MGKCIAVLWLVFASVSTVLAQNSTVAFDNQSGEPALVKLIGPSAKEVEVATGAKETVTAAPGRYYIKVRYGTSGKYHYAKGDEFVVNENASERSESTITLHKVLAGNYESRSISDMEFNADERTSLGEYKEPVKGLPQKGRQVATQDAGRATEGQPPYAIKVLNAERSDKVFMGDISLVPSDEQHVALTVKVNFLKNGKVLNAREVDGITTKLLLLDSEGLSYHADENYSIELGNEANITVHFNIAKDSEGLVLQYRGLKPVPVETVKNHAPEDKR